MAWQVDYQREKINWPPTVNLNKCTKCGMCMNCGKAGLSMDKKSSNSYKIL